MMKKIINPITHEFLFFTIISALLLEGTLASHLFLTIQTLILSIATVTIYTYFATTIVYYTKSKVIKCVFYALVLALFIIDIFLFLQFKSRISPNIILLIAETTVQESMEFIHTYLLSLKTLLIVILTIVFIGIIYFLEKNKRLFNMIAQNRIIKILLFCFLLMGVYSTTMLYYRLLKCQNMIEVDLWMKKYEMRAMDNFSNLTYSLYDISLMNKELSKALLNAEKNIDGTAIESDSLKIIFVIGESHNKWHNELYGYPYHTNPKLIEERDSGRLFIFQDAISPYNLTSSVLRSIFSTNCIGEKEYWSDYAFFPAIFHHAGYDVDFWDNQYDPKSRNSFDFSLNSYLHNPTIEKIAFTHKNTEIFEFDGELVSDYYSYISQKKKPTLTIFHLIGQHFSYYSRYPHNGKFNYFSLDSIKRKDPYITTEMLHIIVDYDNATRYNDFVLYSIIEKNKMNNCALVYISDHSEEIYDYQPRFGRSLEKQVSALELHYQFEVPFYVWCSERYQELHPDIIEGLKSSVGKPFSSDNICHLLFHLAGIKTSYYIPSRDLINPTYQCSKRLVNDLVDYDLSIDAK